MYQKVNEKNVKLKFKIFLHMYVDKDWVDGLWLPASHIRVVASEFLTDSSNQKVKL